MDTTIPRWEWRTFGRDFGPSEALIRRHPLERRDSSETYVVGPRPDINTKIRGDALDVKILQQIDVHRLEQWRPIVKAPFPLTRATLRDVFTVWGLTGPNTPSGVWTERQFLDSIVAAEPSLRVVAVTKQRHGGSIDDCIVEIADLTFDGEPIRTIAVEMTDPDRVWHTVSALALAGYDNVNYVTALMRFLSARTPAPRRALI